MSDEDISYYQRRAEAETKAAQSATGPEAARLHYQMAEAYFDRVTEIDATYFDRLVRTTSRFGKSAGAETEETGL